MTRRFNTAGLGWSQAQGASHALSMKERLDHLRELLRTAVNFRDPWDYFHDALVLDPTFMQLGHPEASRKLNSVLAAIGSRLLGGELQPQTPMLFHLEDLSFWHGTCGLGSHVAVFFHFEAADQGLVGIMKDLTSSEVILARLSLLEMPKGVISVGRGGKA
jgi:hypothetical protein